jgi:segregation and condensation protein A
MKVFEKVMKRLHERNNKPQHVVYRYKYTMEETRDFMLSTARREKNMAFEKIFETAQDRIHAIFMFLTILELVQMKHLEILIGEGVNNFIIEYTEGGEVEGVVTND